MSTLGWRCVWEGESAPIPPQDLRIGDDFCLQENQGAITEGRDSFCSGEKQLFLSSSLLDLTVCESKQIVLLSSASMEILFKSGDKGLVSLWRINQCLYKEEKN